LVDLRQPMVQRGIATELQIWQDRIYFAPATRSAGKPMKLGAES
jgi:hypothetical protein